MLFLIVIDVNNIFILHRPGWQWKTSLTIGEEKLGVFHRNRFLLQMSKMLLLRQIVEEC